MQQCAASWMATRLPGVGPAVTCAVAVTAGLVAGPAMASAKSIALICEGEYRTTTGAIEGSAETSFAGTMHVALVEQDGSFIEIRLQAYEGETRMPVQQYLAQPEPVSVIDADAAPASQMAGKTARVVKPAEPDVADPSSDIHINASAAEVVLHQTTETGPMMRARVDGRPLVPTRESVATVDMRLNRITGDLSLVWGEHRVRDHKLPGALRASKVRLRDEKTFDAACKPVRQRAF